MKTVTIHTDGSCLGNPGPGGWAAVLTCEGTKGPARREMSGGFSRTTNNRMEILAVLEALGALKEPCIVELYTDSQYVAKAIKDRWLAGWLRNNWLTSAKKPVKNQDLWRRMPPLLARHEVRLFLLYHLVIIWLLFFLYKQLMCCHLRNFLPYPIFCLVFFHDLLFDLYL